MQWFAGAGLIAAGTLCVVAKYRWPGPFPGVLKGLAGLMFLALGLLGLLAAPTAFSALMMAALVLGYAGDLLLIFPSDRAFLAGLACFLLGHLGYITAFSLAVGWHILDGLALLALLAGLAVYVRRARLALGAFAAPAWAYLAVIAVMAAKALSTLWLPGLSPAAAACISAGGLLFVVSDAVLAYNRFGPRPLRAGDALVLGTYFCAQGLLALAITLA